MADVQPTIHLQGDEAGSPLCPEPTGNTVPLAEALRRGGRHFDCVACHQLLTGGQRHSGPEGQS